MIVSRNALTPIDFGGLQIFDYTAGRELGSSLAVIEVAPGARHAEAWSRRSDKYYLVTRGAVRFVVNGESRVLGANDFCFIGRGGHFSYANEREEPATLVLVHTPSFDLKDEVFVER